MPSRLGGRVGCAGSSKGCVSYERHALQVPCSEWPVHEAPLTSAPQAKGEVRAVGVAREDGIETAGHSRPLGFSAFEAVSGSTLRRPAANIWTTKGETLVELMARAVGKEPILR